MNLFNYTKQMEKLIKLLNEYTGEEYTHHNDGGWFEGEEPDYDGVCLDVRLKDKDYGFIKWLVDNEKIDGEKVKENGFITRTFDLDECGEPYSDLESILILLAIQDEPINFLIQLLN